MPRRSAGILLYRRRGPEADAVEVLLVHPGGPLWARRDEGAWSLPKGEHDPDEEPAVAARREFAEETGTALAAAELIPLGTVRYSGGKTVTAFAAEGDFDPAELRSNTFSMPWPPRSTTLGTFPEVDRAAWFTPDEARTRLVRAQAEFVDRLLTALASADPAD